MPKWPLPRDVSSYAFRQRPIEGLPVKRLKRRDEEVALYPKGQAHCLCFSHACSSRLASPHLRASQQAPAQALPCAAGSRPEGFDGHPLQGDWICHNCEAGGEPSQAAAQPRTARQKLHSADYSLARIEALWEEPDGSVCFTGRWYFLPEETHTGRQVIPPPPHPAPPLHPIPHYLVHQFYSKTLLSMENPLGL